MKTVGLIQAHHVGWAGARDFSLARVNGKYAIEEVIDRLQTMAEVSAVTIAVPDDPGNEIFRDIAAARGITLTELATHGASLEEAFFELTRDETDYHAGQLAGSAKGI